MQSQRMQKLVAALTASGGTRVEKGSLGEMRARAWLVLQDLKHEEIPQSPETMPATLKARGGKRPDFKMWIDESGPVYYLDAKFHDTQKLTTFHMGADELRQYEIYREWLKDEGIDNGPRQLCFMLYPHELSGTEFLLVELDALLNAEQVIWKNKPARKLLISRDAGAWVKQHEILGAEEEGPRDAKPSLGGSV